MYKFETYASVARHFGDKELLQLAEANRMRALKAKAAQMPPSQRVEHLQKRLREASDELKRRVQEATEEQIHHLQERLREEVVAVDDQRDVQDTIRKELDDAELQIPPKGRPLPTGLQVHPGDRSDELSFEQHL